MPGLAAESSHKVDWSLDGFVVSQGVLFSYGWMLLRGKAPAEVKLEIEYGNGAKDCLPVEINHDRPDVYALHSDFDPKCGFFVFRSVANSELCAARLLARWQDGAPVNLDVPDAFLGHAAATSPSTMRTALLPLAKKAWEHLRRRQFRHLFQKAKRLFPSLRAERIGQDNLCALLQEKCTANATLIVDHRLGGGANIFRDRLITKVRASGVTAALLSFEPPSLRFHLQLFQPDGSELDVCIAPDAWLALAGSRKFSTVYYNNCVSFPNPELIPAMMIHLVRAGGARLVMYFHDHYSICPSHSLIDFQGRYCGLPKAETCRSCLPRIDDGLVSLFRARDIDDWRRRWHECYTVAHEIICFASSGRDALLKAFADLDQDKIHIRPHEIEASFMGGYRYPGSTAPLNIAVVGMISHYKGSEVVLELANEIERRGVAVKIVVIGRLISPQKRVCVEQTGPYRREELPALIGRHGIHMALMPSICPETFSFVTHELISIGVPIMTFDRGAQADAASKAALGKVVELGTAGRLLDDILAFSREIESAFSDE